MNSHTSQDELLQDIQDYDNTKAALERGVIGHLPFYGSYSLKNSNFLSRPIDLSMHSSFAVS